MELFDYTDYRKYLRDWISSQPKKGRGQRARIAAAIRSPVSHVSQVLSEISHLSAEQTEEVNEYLGHPEDHAEYFLLLVQLARAGTPKLRRRIETQVERNRQKRLVLKDRLAVKAEIAREDQVKFYSSWHYVAVHILLTIPEYQSREAISKYLGLSSRQVGSILEFMVKLGLAMLEHGRFKVGPQQIHLGGDSPMISRHHINWRLQAIRSLEEERASDALHYSSVVSISKEDAFQIKSQLVKAIEAAKATIRASKEEEMHSFCLDFFRV